MVTFAIAFKSVVVLILCFAGLMVAERARAAVRHLLVLSAFAVLLILPFIAALFPALPVHVSAGAASWISPVSSSNAQPQRIAELATLLWLIGSCVLALRLIADVLRLQQLRRSAIPWLEARAMLKSLLQQAGVQRTPDLLVHESLVTPITFGSLKPAIILPSAAREWSSTDLQRALVHEIEHIRRADWATQLLARTVCIGYWPNPLAWVAWRRLALEAERACDDAVVLQMESSAYAEQLVALARRVSSFGGLPSIAMAGRSDLSARINAILNATQRRGRAGSFTAAVVLLIAVVAGAGLARIQPAVAQVISRVPSRIIAHQEATAPTHTAAPAPKRKAAPAGRHFASKTRVSTILEAAPPDTTHPREPAMPRNSGASASATSSSSSSSSASTTVSNTAKKENDHERP